MSRSNHNVIQLDKLAAFIFDMDGVVTETARVHAAAWKRTFDEFLQELARREDAEFTPFDAQGDYLRYVDGKPRYDGVRSFLESRSISLPYGDPTDGPDAETVCGLGDRKNGRFLEVLNEQGADAYQTTVDFLRSLQARGIKTAVISASRNCTQVLEAAGVSDMFETRVDGVDSRDLGLAGKPAPDIFLEASRRLGVEPARAAVVEDALAGVEAGRRGEFGLVIGVDRSGTSRDEMYRLGADVVVNDLSELDSGDGTAPARRINNLPSALEKGGEVITRLQGRKPAVFLDYDGTLTPIVDDPAQALLPENTRRAVQGLAGLCTVAVISGRDLDDVRDMVGIAGIAYAGSHGFDIVGPDGTPRNRDRWQGYLPPLDTAQEALEPPMRDIPGALLERKRFAIAVHYRAVDDARIDEVESLVRDVASRSPDLRMTGGKRIFELRPNTAWDKGKAVRSLLEALDLDGAGTVPVFIGDDLTDEDAFRALGNEGIAIVVGQEDRETQAPYALRDPEEVGEFLENLAAILQGAPE